MNFSDYIQFTKEFTGFLKSRKKYWIWPVIIFLLLLGAFIVVAESSSIAPLLYAIF